MAPYPSPSSRGIARRVVSAAPLTHRAPPPSARGSEDGAESADVSAAAPTRGSAPAGTNQRLGAVRDVRTTVVDGTGRTLLEGARAAVPVLDDTRKATVK